MSDPDHVPDPDHDLSDRSRWNAGRRVEVGERVVVRRHLEPGHTSHLYTDVIGHVVELEPELVVRRESGEQVRVPHADIAVLKVLPARPVRNRDIRELEYTGALAWPGTEFELVDGWFCRAGDDWSYRGDSAVPVLPWASCEDVDGVRDWYAARGLPLRLVAVDRLVDAGRLLLDGAPVDPARVSVEGDLHLCTSDSRELVAAVDDQRRDVHLSDVPDDDWVRLYHATAGLSPDRVRPAMLSTAALTSGEPGPGGQVAFARYEEAGELAAIARGAITAGPGGTARVAVSCVETASDQRRKGLAEVVTRALVEWGLEQGVEQCHLHVFDANTAGQGLWSKLGFIEHHTLRHLRVD